ncbi:HAMP domain-containing sensor histidine kinase [Priestia megaterium]|uniref:HAMP domain-containing sensor histidine kinase n=1 Tax=Priestia megaterium TaxID=1404 RepID=UPI00298C1197|nr:HAMP domain-containing sensor histidine kinase [Priestia megaterium]
MKRISVKLLFAMIISFLVANLTFVLFARFVLNSYIQEKNLNVSAYNLLAFGLISIAVVIFVLVFLVLIRSHIRYLKEISEQVQKISNGDLGATIHVRGKDELAELSQNINKMSAQLRTKFNREREIEQAKNELISSVSHDLRTPLTSIVGYLNLIKKRENSDDETLDSYLYIVDSKANYLTDLIEELFDYTKLTSPDFKLQRNEVDMKRLLQQVIGEYEPILKREGIDVQTSFACEWNVFIDVEKMVRVFQNLLENAKKYSRKPSVLEVNQEIQGDSLVISFTNSINISEKMEVEKLFDRFYRGDESRTDANGSGLGLAIAKQIIQLHQGDIRAERQHDKLTFFIKLPLTQESLENHK